jgi:hypothetical protein
MRPVLSSLTLLSALLLGGCASSQAAPCSAEAPTQGAPASSSARADDLDALSDEEVALKLLEVTGAEQLGKMVMDRMLEQFRMMNTLPGFIDKFKERARPEELTVMIAALYVKHYDRATMIAAIRFYRTKEGADLIARTPMVTDESMQVGAEWGRRLAKETLEALGAPAEP